MPARPFATAPLHSTSLPTGIPFIVGNEAAERFSFYGMTTILVTFMTTYLRDSHGQLAVMSDPQAKAYYHWFVASAYFFPLLGALTADVLLGKYGTILSFSIVYCLGHLALAIDDTHIGLFIGLMLIAIGAGGIKPCVSAHVGDQFGPRNASLITKVFSWFYFSINLGAAISTMLTPWLLKGLPDQLAVWFPEHADRFHKLGPHVAFGVPGLLMLIATIVFWLGRYHFVHIPPKGWRAVTAAFSPEGRRSLLRLMPIFACVIFFWALFHQTGSTWVLQAKSMDRRWMGVDWTEEQIQAANPLLVLGLIPLFSFVVFPLAEKYFPFTPLRRIGVGMLLTAAAFAITALLQARIDAGQQPSISWQLGAYVVLTTAEILVSITCLEFSYTQAPLEMKSVVMAIYLLTVSAGNAFTAIITWANPFSSASVTIWFYVGVMLVTTVVFSIIACFYRGRTYVQPEEPDELER